MEQALKVEWIDDHREPKCAPNPAHPDGIDLDCSAGAVATCATELRPYPTPRCGFFLVTCDTCGQRIMITTAGRPDDPRSLKMACRLSEKSKAN